MEPAIQEPLVETSVGKETATQTVKRAQQMLEPSVSAQQLTQPVQAPTITPTPEPTIPERTGQMIQNQLGSIRSTSENAQRLQEEQAAFSTFADESNGFDIQNEQLKRFGVTPDALGELKDIELQLADNQTVSELTKTAIQGAAGQTAGQAGREVTQEQKEEAVRSAGLAARAAVLSNNINTGRQLANDAVNIAMQDRTFKANAMLQQINDLKDTVDEETRQLLEAEERGYQAELATIAEVKENVANAIVNGASQSEIAQMNDPTVSDADKLALAQSITARGSNEIRDLELRQLRGSASAAEALAAQRWQEVTPGGTYTTEEGQQLEIPVFDDWLNENADVFGPLQPEEIANYQKEYDDEVAVMQQAAKVASLSPLAREVINNPQAYYNFTPTVKQEIFEEMAKTGLDTNQVITGKKSRLPATQAESLSQASNVKEDVEKLYTMLKDLPGTGPIAGRLQAIDPYNAKRVAIDAQITRIVPGLARGIFNEVGVLTDQDVERYTNTLANPNMTDEQIELLHNDTLNKIDQSISSTVDTFNALGYSVDGFSDLIETSPVEEPQMTEDEAYQLYLQAQQN